MQNSIQVPAALLESLAHLPYFETEPFLAVHAQAQAPVSIRLNPHKNYLLPDAAQPVAWCENGFYLPSRPVFTLDPLFHAGCYYVQEASSMFIDFLLKNLLETETPIRALDLCAAPGGKSTLLQAALPEGSLLVSNEVIKARSGILAENLSKWGASNTVVTSNDPSDFGRLTGWFDLLLVDAPCSGSGMFRKDTDAIAEWSEENVTLCSQRQQRILADVLPTLKENGLLIYATCSYSEAENEQIVDWLIDEFEMQPVTVPIPSEWGIVFTQTPKNQAGVYRFFPHLVRGEGLFVACLRKTQPEDEAQHRSRQKPAKLDTKLLRKWLSDEQLSFMPLQEAVLAVPADLEADIKCLADNFYLRKAGVRLGELTAKELIPAHELAVSTCLAEDCTRIDLTKEQAIAYLRRDNFELDTNVRGWAVVCYENVPLGWVKALPNRFNNYYPKEWRILMQ
ncbi:16S rRNA C967 or C1407 C5-methylase, RsmB/RsmF family [Flexibacter flexilis DSM 6793]|uniref:16S rRNA C967 or C1407 C5-methylase, RsmB/RsmF family n=1 Tax=Flexibacter flexilis DSM 6793 TaxID=927664 RepID=A0A1I1JEV7_9BACT|nr:RNA methyltransferase [Flexibacter flexilis]SFC44513.1 16S rRNA C967 or C1407 C5-methylase, RsmB/RsmF family [Flexibacter flexilis DSM 6793]